jgi:hypothetical protein
MRILALGILTVGDGLNRAAAQTYDPAYPVCLPATHYDCRYASLPRCSASASGRAAQCVINPYFASPEGPPGLSAASPPSLKLCPRARKPPSLTGPETSAEMCPRCASAKGPFKILSADMRWKGWSTLLGTSHRSAGALGAIPIVMIRYGI